jgi:hypothetical protein
MVHFEGESYSMWIIAYYLKKVRGCDEIFLVAF